MKDVNSFKDDVSLLTLSQARWSVKNFNVICLAEARMSRVQRERHRGCTLVVLNGNVAMQILYHLAPKMYVSGWGYVRDKTDTFDTCGTTKLSPTKYQ